MRPFSHLGSIQYKEARKCLKCHSSMKLANVRPASLGFDTRTYQCKTCAHIESVILESKSKSWPSGGLRAPR